MKSHLMITPRTTFLLALFFAVLMFSCQNDQEPDNNLTLDEIGFVGTLPNGFQFSVNDIRAANTPGLAGNSNFGGFIHHDFGIMDAASGISISMTLPGKKFQESAQVTNLDAYSVANTHYGYDLVKAQLAVGDKKIRSSASDPYASSYYITVLDQRNYNGYTLRQDQLDGDNYLRVLELKEGTFTNALGQNVRTLEVLFDVNVKLFASDEKLPPNGTLKGLLRMRYREDFPNQL